MALRPARPSAPPRNPSTCAPLTWSRRPTRTTLPMICTIPIGVVTSMIMMSPSTRPIIDCDDGTTPHIRDPRSQSNRHKG